MYLFQKRAKTKKELIKNKVKNFRENQQCPECRGKLELLESSSDRSTYSCSKCGNTIVFTDMVSSKIQDKEKRMKTLTLRDRSPKRYDTSKTHRPKISQGPDLENLVSKIKESMHGKKLVAFDYMDTKGRKSQRTAEPYELTTRNSEPLLFAFDTEVGAIRMFRLQSVGNLEVLDYEYTPRYPVRDKLSKKEKE